MQQFNHDNVTGYNDDQIRLLNEELNDRLKGIDEASEEYRNRIVKFERQVQDWGPGGKNRKKEPLKGDVDLNQDYTTAKVKPDSGLPVSNPVKFNPGVLIGESSEKQQLEQGQVIAGKSKQELVNEGREHDPARNDGVDSNSPEAKTRREAEARDRQLAGEYKPEPVNHEKDKKGDHHKKDDAR